jgi:dephospho-CoA kinase
MPVVAITGGIAAGKSVVARAMASRGAVVIDADQLARQAVAPGTPGLQAIAGRFGHGVLTPAGELDRGALGAIVFRDPQGLADLNAIVHPEVRRLYDRAVAEATAADPRAIVVYDIPLLAEARSSEEFAVVVVVDAPADVRAKRLVEARGLSPEEATARITSQATDRDRLALADVVIDASGDEAGTVRQAMALYDELEKRWPDRLEGIPRSFPA